MNGHMHFFMLQGGPYGFLMKLDGYHGMAGTEVKCKSVTGSMAQIDAANPGWKNRNFDDSSWSNAVVGFHCHSYSLI